jgi:hypothetical protein
MGPDPPFDIAVLLAAPDEGSRRIGLTWLDNRERNYRIHEEFLGDRLDDRLVGDGPLSRRTLLRPHAEALVRILREPGAADAKAGAARFLAYSEADGTAGALEPLAADPAPQVREAVAIGLTFLGRAGHLDFLRPILKREITPRHAGVPIAERASTQRLVEDTLIALAHQGSDDAVDLLGETLLADLEDLRPVPDPRGETSLVGRAARATDVCTLLGRTGNPRAVRWLTSAADLIARRPDLAEHFDRSTLAQSMLRFKEQTKGRIAAELESGTAAAVWAYVLRDSRDPDFIPAIRELLRRKDVTAYAMGSGVDYLWNLDSPEAVGVLREAYDRGIMRDEPRQWLRLCEALAASGDGRGLADAFEVLVGLKRPAEPPAEEKERKQWESAREHRLREAEAVFERASKEILDEFLLRRTEADSPAERQVVLRLLWRLPELPEPFAAIVPRWAKGADPQVAETARHLLDRD